jgi:hypothetical protein
MEAGTESEQLSIDLKYSIGQQQRYPPGDLEQGHKSLFLEAEIADQKRKP